MSEWSFLTNHARVLMCIAHDPGVRLRDIATTLGITERSAYGIVTNLAEDGYVVKEKDGRRNRYHIQAHLPLREAITRERTIGDVLDVLVESKFPRRGRRAPVRPGAAVLASSLSTLGCDAARDPPEACLVNRRTVPTRSEIEGSLKRASADHLARPITATDASTPWSSSPRSVWAARAGGDVRLRRLRPCSWSHPSWRPSGTALSVGSTLSVPGAGTTVVSSPDGQRTRTSDPATAATRPSRSAPFIDDRRTRSPTSTMSEHLSSRPTTMFAPFTVLPPGRSLRRAAGPRQEDRSPATAAPGATPRRHRHADASAEPKVDSAELRATSPPYRAECRDAPGRHLRPYLSGPERRRRVDSRAAPLVKEAALVGAGARTWSADRHRTDLIRRLRHRPRLRRRGDEQATARAGRGARRRDGLGDGVGRGGSQPVDHSDGRASDQPSLGS